MAYGPDPDLLPLFPLELVVFPRVSLPLHIFEERYKRMVAKAIEGSSEFGIVLAKQNGIANAGCTVAVDRVLKKYPDGRMDIIARGRRRFEILDLNQEEDVLRGQVEFFEDEDESPPPPELLQSAIEQYAGLRVAGQIRAHAEPNLADPQVSFQIAQGLDDLDFLNLLLRRRSETDRLRELKEFFSQSLQKQRQISRAKDLASKNGFGGKPAGLDL
jgi:Lon protease-like protein